MLSRLAVNSLTRVVLPAAVHLRLSMSNSVAPWSLRQCTQPQREIPVFSKNRMSLQIVQLPKFIIREK
jgi:hypothetical protein